MEIIVDEAEVQQDIDDFELGFKECEKVNDKYGRVNMTIKGITIDLGQEYQKAMHAKIVANLKDEVLDDFYSQLKLK